MLVSEFLKNYEDETEDEELPGKAAAGKPRRTRAQVVAQLVEQADDTKEGFNPSFHSSRHEREWIISYLGGFYEDHLISDVLRQVKGGKEATVYCCAAHPNTETELLAAKVYRPRMFRNLRNDAVYREGRSVLDDQGKGVRGRREALAMKHKTRFGQDLRHMSWLGNEFIIMKRLFDAGADIPRPYTHSENAVLMEYMGDETMPAPVLHSVRLEHDEVRPLFERVVRNITIMLANDCIHGDLSAHNILYWEGEIKIIDFPQAVDPFNNPHATELLERDVKRICQYFERYGIHEDARALTKDIWARCIPT